MEKTTTIKIAILLAFLLGGCLVFTGLYYKGLLTNNLPNVHGLDNIPLCLQKGLVPNRDEKNIIRAIISYDEIMSNRLRLVEKKLTKPLYVEVVHNEILRENKEIETLKQLYIKLYKEEYAPKNETKYSSADNYLLPETSNEDQYLDVFRANLWHVERDYYSLTLASDNKELQKIGNDFASYKIKILEKVQVLNKK